MIDGLKIISAIVLLFVTIRVVGELVLRSEARNAKYGNKK